jgi:adenylyltransferase/sulfurtransferase
MKEIGIDGQRKLKAAKVLIVGAGGLGSPAALYLAGVGIGTIGLVDGDIVEETNLHRQVIHSEERLGIHKV